MGAGAGRFGRSPFGRAPFGESGFVDALPAYFRERDTDERLVKLQRANAHLADIVFQRVEDFVALRSPEDIRVREDTLRPLRLGRVVVPEGVVTRRGGDGVCYVGGEFEAVSGSFTRRDVGSVVRFLSGSRDTAVIVALVSSSTVLLSPPPTEDAGPIRWEIRESPSLPGTLIEVHGDLSGLAEGWEILDGFRGYRVLGRWEYPTRRGPFYRKMGTGTLLSGVLTVTQGSLEYADVGALIALSYPGEEHGVVAQVDTVVSASSARVSIVSPGRLDDGAVVWFVRPAPRVLVDGPTPPKGVVEAYGSDATVSVPGTTATITIPSARFETSDVGRWITLYPPVGSTQGLWSGRISAVPGSMAVTAISAVSLPSWSNARWEVRDAPVVGRSDIMVHAAAPDLLRVLARDSNLELDTLEEAWRRRYYVDTFPVWSGQKGTGEGYRWMGEITGQPSEVVPLYRVGVSYLDRFAVTHRIEARSEVPGKSGTAGSLSVYGGGRLQLSDPAASFDPTDKGKLIHVLDAGVVANRRYFTIDRVLSPTMVVFRPSEPGFVETGTVEWVVAVVYVEQPPTRVHLDEVNTDVVEALRDPSATETFWADGFGWEDGFGTEMVVTLTAVSSAGRYRWVVTATGPAWAAIVSVGWWRFVDSTDTEFWVETVPVLASGSYTFEVRGVEAPTLGSATLSYLARTVPETDYAPVPVGLLDVNLITGTDGQARFQRVVSRIESQVLPAHARLIARQIVTFEAAFDFTAEVEPEYGPSLLAPMTAYFDEVEGDMVPADTGLHASGEVET